MALISVTFEVLKLLKSKDFKLRQSKNIQLISLAIDVLSEDKSIVSASECAYKPFIDMLAPPFSVRTYSAPPFNGLSSHKGMLRLLNSS